MKNSILSCTLHISAQPVDSIPKREIVLQWFDLSVEQIETKFIR